jgi:hypothetical protein
VLVVSCPQCGGSVRDADLGERTKCQYCDTDLHLPTVDFTPDSPESEPPRPRAAPVVELELEQPLVAAPRQHHQLLLWGLLAAILVGTLIAMMSIASRSPTTEPVEPTPAPQSVRDKEMDGVMANANCTIDCTKPCMNISEPSAMIACLDKCDAKCKFVGKGTPSECRSRCSGTCASAPDAASRAACESGCMQGCPPG